MSNETYMTIVGNLTDEPQLRFVPSGAAVANFTIASTPRRMNRNTNEWEDGEALFMRCSLWRQAAENVAELPKGTRVVAYGQVKQRSYETREGEKRTVIEMEVDEIGPSLRYASVRVNKTERASQQRDGRPSGPPSDPWATAPPEDPWGSRAR
jgi:single-strand DNA-binding protein